LPNNLGLAGAQAQKQTRFDPLYTGRWSSGLWTNRSPLRDATTSRIVEKFYGASGDALIAGLNTEITNKLTLARRPGNSVFDSNTWTNVDRFYDFKVTNATTEEIIVMVDEANAVFSLLGGVKTLLFNKSTGAGQTYFQQVGNNLYMGDGVDTLKWIQTNATWQASTDYGTPSLPFFSTFFIDANGHILQCVGTNFPITGTSFTAPTPTTQPTVTIQSSINLGSIFNVGDIVTFPVGMSASYLDSQSATILSFPSSSSMVVTYPLNWLVTGFTTTTESTSGIAFNSGEPVSGTVQPVGTGPSTGSTFFGVSSVNHATILPQFVFDGSVVWADRGLQTEPWGLKIPDGATLPIVPVFSPNGVAQTGTASSWVFYSSFPGGTGFGTNFYVVDSNNNLQFSAAGGTSGLTPPTWNTILGETTTDGSITWTLVYEGVLSPQNGGYTYYIAIVNTLDNTVSNAVKISNPTGNFIGAQGIQIPPGAGLPPSYHKPPSLIAQGGMQLPVDYVAIFRTTDGEALPLLIPGASTTYTLPLAQYIAEGYIDNTADVNLNELISAPIGGENTIPLPGAINLAYHLNRLWWSVGNVVYWSSGSDSPVGNGIDGYNPLNFDQFPSLVTRLVPTAAGMMVFTISDIYLIQGNGTTNSPILQGIPLLPGIGLRNYNALDSNGPIIGFFSTDRQFIILDPSSGTTYAGFPIGDQLRMNTGNPGQSWNPNTAYVAWHTNGEDQAWYLGDAVNGWYRLMTTPAPETGFTWSPFASIIGGVKALQSIETSPGVHDLLLGPIASGPILRRDLTEFTDNGSTYESWAVVGSAVLTQPGQVAEVDHITTDAVRVGVPVQIGVIVDEALPYYTGPFDILTRWTPDPPNLKESTSLYSQRFYLAELQDETAVMRHMQMKVIFSPNDAVQNELLTLTVFGAYSQEL
jgi:hypothetical protein